MRTMSFSVFCLFFASAAQASDVLSSQKLQYTYNKKSFEDHMKSFREIPAPGRNIKIHDLVDIQGQDKVRLNGFGVVTGLNKTGDSGPAAIKMILSIAKKQGIHISEDDIKLKNVALVSISAEVNPHERRFDIAIKSISDSKSLQNGFLEAATLTPIGSEEIYGIATGSVALGARYFEATGAAGATSGGTTLTIGHPSAGFVINGGELVRDLPSDRIENGVVKLYLKHPDDRTAANVADIINDNMGSIGIHAEPTSSSEIEVAMPKRYHDRPGELTRAIADIGDLSAKVARKAVITIDQGSGVIAMTEGVKLEPGSIAVAGLTVTVTSNLTPVTRQGAFDGSTEFADAPELEVSQDQVSFLTVPAGTDLRKVQETFNALRLQPTSIISVFNAMHQAGMIHADIEVIPR